MPLNRRRFYPTSQGAIIFVALVGCVAAALRNQIPPPPENILGRSDQPYLRASLRHQIPWQKLSPKSLSEARRSGKPTLILIGEPASRSGRLLDKSVFQDPEVADLLSRSFYSIRADASVEPYVASMFDPIVRAGAGWDPSCQIWFLDTKGRKYGSKVFEGSRVGISTKDLLETLKYNQSRFYSSQDSLTDSEVAGESQSGQAQELLYPSGTDMPDDLRYFAWLKSNMDPESGGWPIGNLFRLNPPACEFLLITGEYDLLKQALDPILQTGIVDWTGGGFFYQARQKGWRQVDYDKYVLISADMATVLAKMNASFPMSLNRTIYRKIALDTFDSITSSFTKDGIILPWRVGDELGFNRSARSSYSIRWLADQGFSPEQNRDFRNLLGLDVGKNLEMVPLIPNLDTYEINKEKTDKLIAALRSKRPETGVGYAQTGKCDSASLALARVLEIAIALDDPERLEVATDMFTSLRKFRVGIDDVVRDLEADDATPAYLGDYLGFSDAALQMYKATGDWAYFDEASLVFKRARELFDGPSLGILVSAPNDPSVELPPDCKTPEVVDRLTTSLSGISIRLAMELEAGERARGNAASADEYRRFAFASLRNLGAITNQLNRRFSGIFRGAYQYNRDAFVTVSGRESLEVAKEIGRRSPGLRIFSLEGKTPLSSNPPEPMITIYLKNQKLGPMPKPEALAVITENRL